MNNEVLPVTRIKNNEVIGCYLLAVRGKCNEVTTLLPSKNNEPSPGIPYNEVTVSRRCKE